MAHKKAYEHKLRKCQKEALNLVYDWFVKYGYKIDKDSLYVVWFAFTITGYKCMINSKMYSKRYFEVTKNLNTNETIINCFELTECIVHPSESPILELHDRFDDVPDPMWRTKRF